MRFSQVSSVFVVTLYLLVEQLDMSTTTSWCHHISDSAFKDCGNNKTMRKKARDRSRVRNSSTADNTTQHGCQYTDVCRKTLNVARFRRLSFSVTLSIEIADMLQSCCGNCTKYNETLLNPPLDKVRRSSLESFDIIYPVYAQSTLTEMHGFHFIPVLNIPGAYYFTLQTSDGKKISNMARALAKMWPLLAVSLLLCSIAGFIIWLLDTWSNRSEFPRSFIAGTREGFWWSFVSMTTVGYGDKIPKSQAARVIAVVWILVGITAHTIFTAKLTSDITAVQGTLDPPLDDQTVGVLENRMYDLVMVSQHRGIIRQFQYNNTILGLVEMIECLAAGEIDGWLISIETHSYFSRNLRKPDNESYREPLNRIKDIRLDRWEKDFRSERLVAGMLVKNTSDYNYYRKFIESNWLDIQVCYSRDLTYNRKTLERHHSNTMEGMFVYFCYSALWILLGVFCFGAVYEFVRWKRWIRCDKKKDRDDDVENNHMRCVEEREK